MKLAYTTIIFKHMKNKFISVCSAVLLLGVSANAFADEQSAVTTEQHNVQVDPNTGDVNEQHRTQKDSTKQEVGNGQARVEKEHSSEGSASNQNIAGGKDQVSAQHHEKTAVTADSNGVTVEQTKQHSEQQKTQ